VLAQDAYARNSRHEKVRIFDHSMTRSPDDSMLFMIA
jgi:hypothetical protein